MNDLGNSASAVARIASDTSSDYSSAVDNERVLNGYFTDANGLLGGVQGLSVIW